ncbi:MAG: hypothetical protein ABI743_12055, partial [bacterium]
VDMSLGSGIVWRDRVISLTSTVTPSELDSDTAGVTEEYKLALSFSTDGATFQPATLLSVGGAATSITQAFPVGTTTMVVLKWDRDTDIAGTEEDNVSLKLVATQVAATGTGSVTKGPKIVDTGASGACAEDAPRLSTADVTLSVGVPATKSVTAEFGDLPLSYSINEPLQGGLIFHPDGSITGTPTAALSSLRLITVTDNCGDRTDEAWITIQVS